VNYKEILIDVALRNHSLICMGADPILERIPTRKSSIEERIFCFYEDIIHAILNEKASVSALKPNYAFYAQYGFEGLRALKRLIEFAKTVGLPVILDVKRGDIGKTSEAYTREVFDFFAADSVTVSPYMGSDSISPFINRSKKEGKGVYILARTSNFGAKDFQDLVTNDGKAIFHKVVEKIALWSKNGNGNIGAVVGATSPIELAQIARLIAITENTVPLLIPGVGTQGGSVNDVISNLVNAWKEAGLDFKTVKTNLLISRINSSSGINYAYEKMGISDYSKAAVEAVKILNNEVDQALSKQDIKLFYSTN
jgi:orotidine-5'-phosphate decarboxylase